MLKDMIGEDQAKQLTKQQSMSKSIAKAASGKSRSKRSNTTLNKL